MTTHRIVSREEWIGARLEHLAREKEFTRLRDELSRQRRDLPWVKVDKAYVFDGPRGPESLADLFERRSQLVVQKSLRLERAKARRSSAVDGRIGALRLFWGILLARLLCDTPQ